MSFLNSPYTLALTIALVVQTAAYYAADLRRENIPNAVPLETFPFSVKGWQMVSEHRIEREVQDVLKADDTMNRTYAHFEKQLGANLFIAFFKTQRAGQAPHSPKNCLPGSGWEPSSTGTMQVSVEGRPITINRYIVARGEDQSVVLYWYQSHNRVIASEFEAKFWLVADAIRYNRSDTALVRVVVPVRGQDPTAAVDSAVAFVQDVYPEIRKQLPM